MTFQASDSIHEGGLHGHYSSSDGPANIADPYQSAIEENGWTIEGSGPGAGPVVLSKESGKHRNEGGSQCAAWHQAKQDFVDPVGEEEGVQRQPGFEEPE